ncbi:ATP-binding protein [Vibrio natriegens]|uniref:ATP-binding protein n=1 Tax=Vibrio natriegens TaxID=691 RepID=UPI0021E72832|nr:ATP-binding protein [Vibrio natriegens]UYI49585.1 ATP-binding protein [Vibrio natriegens]
MAGKLMVKSVTYEEDFLVREIGSIATKADVAITELIANAHDAGATRVKIIIPTEINQNLVVEDNGVGMTNEQFEARWMRLRYDRHRHQGRFVDVPSGAKLAKRRHAFGRNGVGRHAGLCFNDGYEVETWRDGTSNIYELRIASGSQPIQVVNESYSDKEGHGTKIKVLVEKNLPDVEDIRNIISARFLFNPEFVVEINGKQVQLAEHPGYVKETTITPMPNISIKLTLVDSSATSRTAGQHGVSFWLGGRLLGDPSWSISGHQVMDGRKSFAKRYTLIAESEDLFDYVHPDWSGFKPDFSTVELIADQISNFVKATYLEVSRQQIESRKREVINHHKREIKDLPTLARQELYAFIDQILEESPDIKIELLELAFRAALNLEKSRSGVSLLYKLTHISMNDTVALNQFLEEWSVSDAMEILSEIDSRLKVIEAISRLSSDKTVDELHTLHPLIEKARWVFGPEFDTPEYASNKGLVKTMQTVFKRDFEAKQFENPRKRPDIVVGERSTISALGLEGFEGEIKKTQKVLIIELKKGGFEIGRDEMHQAKCYVEDILHAGVGSNKPFIKAYVVGDTINSRTSSYQSVGDNPESLDGEIRAMTYGELIRTAEARLFALRETVENRYEGLEKDDLLCELLNLPDQQSTFNFDQEKETA